MSYNNGFIVIGQDLQTKNFWIQQRENVNEVPGKVNMFADGQGDIRPSINSYVEKGFAPERIIYNGQPVTDVFTKTVDEEGKVSFKGGKKGKVEFAKDDPTVRQYVITQSGQKIAIPVMLGSITTVKPLRNGTYKVISRLVTNTPQKPSVKVVSEAELIEMFGRQSSKIDIQA